MCATAFRRNITVLDVVEETFVRYPIPLLQVVGTRVLPFLYEVDWPEGTSVTTLRREGRDRVRFLDGVADRLVVLGPLLRPLIELQWARDVARWTGVSTEDDRLHAHLFGTDRVPFPAALREGLAQLQDGGCFYCGRRLTSGVSGVNAPKWQRSQPITRVSRRSMSVVAVHGDPVRQSARGRSLWAHDDTVLDVGSARDVAGQDVQPCLDVGRGKESRDLVRLRLSKALLGVAEAQALAAESIAIERGVTTEKIADAEGLALHAGAFNGIPDPVIHLSARAMGIVTGLAMVEPDPRAPDRDAALGAALQAATGLAKLLGFRRDCVTAATPADEAEAMAKLAEAGAQLASAAEAVQGLLDLAELTAASGRKGKPA